jgi:hypothetical protein
MISLGTKLFLCFLAFLSLMGVVMWVSFRERKLAQSLADTDLEAQRASDARTLLTIFGAVIGGMMLTLIVAWIVFL